MKHIALIIAGGSGQRMHQDIPKQFISIDNKPIIIYTLEAFQKHTMVDAIIVVCIDGWHDVLRAYAKQFNITKLVSIVSGGKNGQESIKNGLLEINRLFHEDDIVLIHDGIRPMVSEEIISSNIVTCKQYGSAITAIDCAEAMLMTDDKVTSFGLYDRDKLMRTQTPQTFPLKKLLWAHDEAQKRDITNSVATCTLMSDLGEILHMVQGSEKNVKLTTTDDLEIFEALLKIKKNNCLK